MIFEEILGNEKNKEILQKIIETEKISHSYMFVGPSSIGKKLIAFEFAKAILCGKGKGEKPCNNCISCTKFDNTNHPDFFILDGEETIKNEQIREMNKKIIEKPIEATKKVYIINNSENMTQQAQNSLLKTLEEPPEHAVIILITRNENMLLTTIKSRCMKLMFNPLGQEDLMKILRSKYKIEDCTKELVRLSEGSIEKAIKIHENEEIYNKVKEVFLNLKNLDIIDLMKQKEVLFKDKENIYNILEYINVLFYELSEKDAKYFNCITYIENAKERLTKNSNYDMTIDNLLLTIWEEIND